MRRILLIIGCCLLTIGVIELGFLYVFWLPTHAQADWTYTQQQKMLRSAEEFDVLILGDSTAGNGVIPSLFQERTGMRAHNFGTTALVAAFADPVMLLTYLEHHPPPRAIIVVRSLNTWVRQVNYGAMREDYLDPNIVRFLYKEGMLTTEEVFSLALARILPTYRYRNAVRRWWKDYREDFVAPEAYTDGFIRDDQVMRAVFQVGDLSLITNAYDGKGFLFNADQILLLDYLCSIAQQHRIPTFVIIGPYSQDFAQLSNVQAYATSLKTVLNLVTAQHPACTFIDGRRTYSSYLLSNPTHVNYSGALLFTADLANELRKYAPFKEPQ
ncbi:MAG: hypothetical protein Q7R81_04495 [Candidatus Peregrinibacteria bacterium]|nr:hypothetical protein [Candidatus Peregrinibacteria bacterium]